MRLSVNFGLTYFDLQVGRLLTLEVDLHGTMFVRGWGLGQAWLQRGQSSFDAWRDIQGELIVP